MHKDELNEVTDESQYNNNSTGKCHHSFWHCFYGSCHTTGFGKGSLLYYNSKWSNCLRHTLFYTSIRTFLY